MTDKKRIIGWVGVFCVIALAAACTGSSDEDTLHYAIEANDTLYGYVETKIIDVGEEGSPLLSMKDEIRSISRALGMDVNVAVDTEYTVDPATGRFSDLKFHIDQGSVQIEVTADMDGDTILITRSQGGGTRKVALVEDGILSDYSLYPRLLQDFDNTGLEEKTYPVLDLMDREFQTVTYFRRDPETITLAGTEYDALVLDALNREIGSRTRVWIDRESGRMLQTEIPGLQKTFLTDKSIKHKLRRLDRDAQILANAGIMIQDYRNISHLKVKAVLHPIGNWITPESLTFGGQTFTGTVEDNVVEGIFEIRHEKYDGSDPPPFPPEPVDDPELQPYLEPEDLIESDDPALIEKARELTAGATDSWDAAQRLGRWVADEIGYAIPGGGSARNTYDLRNGECGAHSRLYAAFCRAAGIPARVVWGCMYIPNNDGSFGQHGWNEIHMGKAGWIPVDTTVREIDYCDSGHIRLGILSSMHISYNPREFEILDFTAGTKTFADAADSAVPAEFEPYVGIYQGPERAFTVLVQNKRLAVDVPGRMIFELREPDEQGRRFFVVTPDVHILFQEEGGAVTGMTLVNTPRIPRKGSEKPSGGDVPDEFRGLCGVYPIPGQGEIRVFFSDGGLGVTLPPNHTAGLEGPDEEGMWKLEGREDRFSFVLDDEGTARAIVIHELVHFDRIE